MKHPTDEWMVTGFGSDGKRRRFVIHHDPADLFTDVAMHAVTSAIASWGGSWGEPGNSVTIVAIVNQEAEDEPPFNFDEDNPFGALAESYREFPRRTCPGGYDYAGHVCGQDCRAKEADGSAVLPDQVNRPGAPA